MEYGIGTSYLNPLNVTIEKSINEYIRENDSKQKLIEITRKKIEQNANLIDLKARYLFKNPTVSLLKCSYGFNQHRYRYQLINHYSENKCV